MKTILAVAIGNPANNQVFKLPNPNLSAVRPYIQGLVDWLAHQTEPPAANSALTKYNIGVDYQIDYRECDLGGLAAVFPAAAPQADLIFCMSTSVARAADAYAKANAPTQPIVAIVSDPFGESVPFGDNLCGVSASRDRLANHCLKQFRKQNPNVKNVYALHRKGYSPSTKATGWLGKKNVTLWPIADTDNIQGEIQKIINLNPPKLGFLILPADRFFGSANDIVQWAGNYPTFWSTPDFPAGSFGGYGYPQVLCGQFMAERVANIWTSQDAHAADPMPDPAWVLIDPQYVKVKPGTLTKSAKKTSAQKPAKKSSAKKKPAKKSSAKKSTAKKSAKRRKKTKKQI